MCDARQYSDQMICGKCGLQWDINDPDPPECNPVKKDRFAELRAKFNLKKCPDVDRAK